MTTSRAVGAVSREAAEWYAMDWQAINRNVRRLQVRIVQATKAGRWGKVRALQRLLTHSYSGNVLAVRRVTENQGKKTPGVDQEIWDTPEKKIQAVHELKRRGYQPLRLSAASPPILDTAAYPWLLACMCPSSLQVDTIACVHIESMPSFLHTCPDGQRRTLTQLLPLAEPTVPGCPQQS